MDQSELSARVAALLDDRGVTNAEIVDFQPLLGGYSQLSYRFAVVSAETRTEYVLRMDRPAEATLVKTDRRAEWTLLRSLNSAGAAVPTARWADLDGSELGACAIISDYVDAPNLLAVAQEGRPGPELAEALTETAAAVHGTDLSALPAELERPASWDAYLDAQIDCWREVEQRHAERLPIVRLMARWLEEHRPEPTGLTLVHGEFSLSNVLLDEAGVTTAVDWENAHIGDPRIDLGWCMSRGTVEPPNVIGDHLPQVCRRYREITGLPEEVINPSAIEYFAILSASRAWGRVLEGITAMANEQNDLVLSAFVISAWDIRCREWLRQIENTGTASPSPQRVMEPVQ